MSQSKELPFSWARVRLGDVVPYGEAEKTEPADIPADAWMLELEDIEKDSSRLIERVRYADRKSKSTKNRFRRGDVLYGKLRPYLNKVLIADRDGYCTTEIVPIRATATVDHRYLFYWLKHLEFLEYVNGVSHGLNMPRLGTEAGRNAPFILAPLGEQRRIAAALDSLFQRVSRCRQRLELVPALLKRFRVAVLEAATTGIVTEEFRRSNRIPHQASLPGHLAERHREAWIERRGGKGRVYVNPQLSTTTALPRLPESWHWVRLGLLGQDPLAAVQTGPFGALLHSDEFVPEGVPVIAVGNLTGISFTKEGLYFVDRRKAEQLKSYDVQAGDLLFARSGATLGKVCVAPDYVRDWRMTGHILRVRVWRAAVLPRYVAYCLWGNTSVLSQIFGSVRGMTRPGYNTSLLEAIPLPVPPIEEQREIVRRVDELFVLADSLEERYEAAVARLATLSSALLAKAFRGELVPQDPEDEPAMGMLERIKAELPEATRPSTQASVKFPGHSAPQRAPLKSRARSARPTRPSQPKRGARKAV